MGATVRDFTARREDGEVRLTGTVETTEDGWTVKTEADNPGVAGDRDKDVRVKITATAPEVGQPVLTTEPINETFSSNPQDTRVVVRLIGLETQDGKSHVAVPIDG
jgi:hypothetical protein